MSLIDLSKSFDPETVQHTNFFKPYSLLLRDWLQRLTVPGESVSVHYGKSERVWTKIVRERKNYSIVRPICSFNLKSWEVQKEHNQIPDILYSVGGNYINAKPGFYNLTYEVNFWFKYLKESDTIKYQIENSFTPQMYLMVDQPEWKKINDMPYYCCCMLKSCEEVSEGEGDKNEREIKLNMVVEMDARLPRLDRGYVAKKIEVVETFVSIVEDLEKKKSVIKDNIQDDVYLEHTLSYIKRNVSF